MDEVRGCRASDAGNARGTSLRSDRESISGDARRLFRKAEKRIAGGADGATHIPSAKHWGMRCGVVAQPRHFPPKAGIRAGATRCAAEQEGESTALRGEGRRRQYDSYVEVGAGKGVRTASAHWFDRSLGGRRNYDANVAAMQLGIVAQHCREGFRRVIGVSLLRSSEFDGEIQRALPRFRDRVECNRNCGSSNRSPGHGR